MRKIKISYKELFKKLKIDDEVDEEIITKFNGIKIKNGDSFVSVEAFVKKPVTDIIQIDLENGLKVKCAKKHIFLDEYQKEVFAEDAVIIKTLDGNKKIVSKKLCKRDYVYDVALPAPHIYTTTNGIIHHNTKLGDAYMNYMLESAKNLLVDVNTTHTNMFGETIKESEGIKVAYIKNESILSDDVFWNILREEEYHIVFLDDLDYSLIPRTQNIASSEDIQKNKFISNLLSFTDGIFEAGNKTKFIITSNRSVTDIDGAILRKGRTFDILNLRDLTKEEALKIWLDNDLDIETFNDEFESNKVLQADLGSSISTHVKARELNIELKPYVKEAGISIYNEYAHPKSFGI